jgi:hypothetical protein
MDPAIDGPSRRWRIACSALVAVAAGALVILGGLTVRWWTHRNDPVPVTITFQHCANPDFVHADGSEWESTEVGPSAWGGDEAGHLEINGDSAIFRSAADGRTLPFHRLGFSDLTCWLGPRP